MLNVNNGDGKSLMSNEMISNFKVLQASFPHANSLIEYDKLTERLNVRKNVHGIEGLIMDQAVLNNQAHRDMQELEKHYFSKYHEY